MTDHGAHESFREREAVKGSSDRTFGFVFSAFFTIIGLVPLIKDAQPRRWAVGIAVVFLVAAIVYPTCLAPLNRLWTRLGAILHRIINPVVMGLLFFLVVTPIALIMRLTGKRPLRLDRDPSATTYWIRRNPPGPAPETMKQQF